MEPLVDSWGREIRSLRVSVTDKCNFRCRYCMPAEGLEWLPREEVLSFEEIARLVRQAIAAQRDFWLADANLRSTLIGRPVEGVALGLPVVTPGAGTAQPH